MNQTRNLLVFAFIALTMSACGRTQFAEDSALQKAVAEGEGEELADGRGRLPQNGDEDDDSEDCEGGRGTIPQPSFAELLVEIETNTNERTLFDGHFRCYISHSGGHGIELCLTGEKAELKQMMSTWKETRSGEPVEVKGDDLCIRPSFIKSNPELFEGATVGSC